MSERQENSSMGPYIIGGLSFTFDRSFVGMLAVIWGFWAASIGNPY